MKQTGMIHNVIVTNDNGTILLSAYWDGSTPTERGKFEHDLYLQTRPEWIEIKPPKDDVDNNKCVVYQKANDVVFFITGSVSEILTVIMNGFVAMCPKKQLWCREFANDNTFGKMVAMLDQIIYMGQYCQSDIVVADGRAKMKSI
ncbi:hypothetical protein JH06_0280 [Blastocystis sp. subtype 4]|uniref:hypothetical protein n=1 Tax=Blastocystis sp. subtype 4 TaxID=944170 RepID=UPI000711B534|nr:hypothetical protein JH06_0280 [Blastocystis sp. subtype 4]KNB46100.1 hypothetical protein JH06_0280 [Blastocystis sp. subtype 4]|eukprot:XP_014529543.1 hypothetical protein JH06_0280 [Blastocystis sp. subtype 4]